MSKYGILNCWDDLNKGDLGIMIATVEEFKRRDKKCEFIGVSSFNKYDESFINGHDMLKKYVPNVYPAIFGTLGLNIFNRYRKDLISKFFAFVIENIRFFLCMLLPVKLAELTLTKTEKATLTALRTCDKVFSKGGSVFTDYGHKRGVLALIRLCRFYKILHKFGIKYYILAQSFGPITSSVGIRVTNELIDNAQHVYLREWECARKYTGLHLKGENVSFSNDAGFLINPQMLVVNNIDHKQLNIGMTIRCESNDEMYLSAIEKTIGYLIEEKGAYVHIFQQVSMDSEPDNVTADIILKRLNEDILKNVIYHTEKLFPQELCYLYGEMDYFIGTRLHSTIFAMRVGTPTIAIAYHGTKTQGIFMNIGVPELVISNNISFESIRDKFEYMIQNRQKLVNLIKDGVARAREDMQSAIREIIND